MPLLLFALLSVLTIICFFALLILSCLFNFLYYKNKSSLVSTFLSYKYGLTLNLEEDLRILKVSMYFCGSRHSLLRRSVLSLP